MIEFYDVVDILDMDNDDISKAKHEIKSVNGIMNFIRNLYIKC